MRKNKKYFTPSEKKVAKVKQKDYKFAKRKEEKLTLRDKEEL